MRTRIRRVNEPGLLDGSHFNDVVVGVRLRRDHSAWSTLEEGLNASPFPVSRFLGLVLVNLIESKTRDSLDQPLPLIVGFKKDSPADTLRLIHDGIAISGDSEAQGYYRRYYPIVVPGRERYYSETESKDKRFTPYPLKSENCRTPILSATLERSTGPEDRLKEVLDYARSEGYIPRDLHIASIRTPEYQERFPAAVLSLDRGTLSPSDARAGLESKALIAQVRPGKLPTYALYAAANWFKD